MSTSDGDGTGILVRLSDASAVQLLTAFPSPSSSLLLLYHCSQPLVRHQLAPGEVERRERSKVAHCCGTRCASRFS
jgi:hypothetical protein